jgi:DNA (cytosine-5)-methyltransferase 1
VKFIDLFSGVGGFRLGLERNGYTHVWSNDIDDYANQIYTKNFGTENHHSGDVRGIDPKTIPNHDLLCAGFPCQSFSVAGQRKGFEDTRGTLFFEICRITEAKRPRLLLLENVKGLLYHDRGRTFSVILKSLEDLGYWWEYQVLNSLHFGVPQNRERVFIIGHLRGESTRAVFPILEGSGVFDETDEGTPCGDEVASALTTDYHKAPLNRGESYIVENGLKVVDMKQMYREGTVREYDNVSPTISTPSGGQRIPLVYWKNSKEKVVYEERESSPSLKTQTDLVRQPLIVADRSRAYRGGGRNLESPKKHTNTLTGVEKDNYVIQPLRFLNRNQKNFDGHAMTIDTSHSTGLRKGDRIRKLTPLECERLQGFPDGWTEGVSDTRRYKALGNAVTVNVIYWIGKLILEAEVL